MRIKFKPDIYEEIQETVANSNDQIVAIYLNEEEETELQEAMWRRSHIFINATFNGLPTNLNLIGCAGDVPIYKDTKER